LTVIETFTLPGPASAAWELLVDHRAVLGLTPGLTVGPGGRGTLRIVLASHSLTYRGYARQHIEEEGRHLTWTLSGKEVRGTGRAHAEVRARFRDNPEGSTDLRLTVLVEGRGRLADASPAELDRVVKSILAKFRRALTLELEGTTAREHPTAVPEPAAATAQPEPSFPVSPTPPDRSSSRVEIVLPARRWRRQLPAAVVLAAVTTGVAVLLLRRSRQRR
jgi:carbon monoxide dehydrogenase subunit G